MGLFSAQKTLINTRLIHQNTLKNWHIFCISY